jgi:hypothetical protein
MNTPKLIYNHIKSQGEIKFPNDWSAFDDAIKLDILSDWIADLKKEYEQIKSQNNPVVLGALGQGEKHGR